MSIEGLEEYEKNTQEQYAALGRFVEAFERMVHEARDGANSLMLHGYHLDPLTALQISTLISIPLYHQALAAKPIFEIFRALLMEKITDPSYRKTYNITDEHVVIFGGALGAISGEYEFLANKRNELLHGTWFIGFTDETNPHAAQFQVNKYKTTGSGMSKLELPKTAPELDALSERCDEALTWIAAVQGCVPPTKAQLKIEECFRRSRKTWERIWPSQHKFPPKPS
jgi:hypothetical protein